MLTPIFVVFYCYTGVLEAGYRPPCFIERNHWIWCTQLSLRSFLDHWDGRRMEIKCAPWNFLRKSFSIGMCCKLGAQCMLVMNMNLLLRDSSTTFGCTHEWWICFISEENNRFYARTWQMLQRCCTCPGILHHVLHNITCWCLLVSWPLNFAASLHKSVFTVSRLTNSAANRSIGSTTVFHNHGEGPY